MSEDIVPNLAQAGLAVPALVLADGLSYEDYFRQINRMAEQMRARWQREEKVGALKVAIQLSKLLADTSQLRLYQKKYLRVMEILDEFGRYIYDRVHKIAAGGDTDPTTEKQDDDKADNHYYDPRELAKDIYRNWQFKILSIRELVPRFYTELAILRASDILFTSASKSILQSLEEQFYLQALKRLSNYCVGLGDPIVSLHARAYLCKIAERLLIGKCNGNSGESILISLLALNLKAATVHVCRLDMTLVHSSEANLYFELLSSSFASILNIVTTRYSIKCDEKHPLDETRAQLSELLEEVLGVVTKEDPCGFRRNVILNSIFTGLPNEITHEHADRLMDEIRASHDRWLRLAIGPARDSLVPTIYSSLSSFLTALDGIDETFDSRDGRQPQGEGQASPASSSLIRQIESIMASVLEHERRCISNNYLKCFKALLTFASHHAPTSLDRPLTTLVEHMRRGRQYISHSGHLMDIIKTLFTQQHTTLAETRALVALRSFNQLFDCLRKDEHRLDVTKYIMEMLRSNVKLSQLKCCSHKEDNEISTPVRITDRTMITFLLKLFDALNNSLSPLTAQEDLGHLSEVVIFFIELVHFDDVLETVEFYSRCRASLGNLNLTLVFLIERTLELPQTHRKMERRRNARRDVLNCCLAFAFTTLPAVHDQRKRVGLYLHGCKLALAHNSLLLADYFMRQIMVNLLGMVESYELEQQRQQYANGDAQFERLPSSRDRELNRILKDLLDMTICHQDHIDLKHKISLSQLIRVSFAECPNLLRSLSNLNCVDDDQDDARGGSTINNIEI